jgi:hypothetical protein
MRLSDQFVASPLPMQPFTIHGATIILPAQREPKIAPLFHIPKKHLHICRR